MSKLALETVQWSSLPEIGDVEPISETDQQVLAEIREVLARHNRMDRFGICLLHKHFEITADEIAVEYTNVQERKSTVIVEPKDASAAHHIETAWRFKNDGPEAVTVCEQRCYKNNGHRLVHVSVGR